MTDRPEFVKQCQYLCPRCDHLIWRHTNVICGELHCNCRVPQSRLARMARRWERRTNRQARKEIAAIEKAEQDAQQKCINEMLEIADGQ